MKKTVITKNDLLSSFGWLENKAEYDLDYVFLVATASAICALGFRMNSPSVIIGAMVVSPLLFTVVGAGAALYWKKWKNFFDNLMTLMLGMVISVLVTLLINIYLPAIGGSEIIGRISNGLVDYFFVAFFSGLAGTFAFFWPEIIEAVAGIAISVALLPPVVMTGIGLATQNFSLFVASLLIVFINVIGILVGSFTAVFGLNLYSKK